MDRLQELQGFVRDCDPDLKRSFPFEVEEVRDSGDARSAFNMRGYASVYDSWSLDLGGFRERVMPGAFDDVLTRTPPAHVVHVWDHDTTRVLSTTDNGTLTLGSDTHGLQYYSRVAKTSYAADLRVLLERGDIRQSSFAFTVAEDEWRTVQEDGEEIIERDVVQVKDLYDVTTTALGAYPATTSAVALRSLVSGHARAEIVAPQAGDGREAAPPEGTPQTDHEAVRRELDRLKRESDEVLARARERALRRGKERSHE